jgi:AmmeMemoRadiSam system protein B
MENLRKPAVAGSFYPGSEDTLRHTIKDFLEKVSLPKNIPFTDIKAAIVPHAGYFYSGLTATFAYKTLSKKKNLSHFILLGPSHFSLFTGACQDPADFWETPLGKVKVKHLPEEPPIITNSEPHLKEHCLEVQLPFLQLIFKTFSITPIVISENCDYLKLAKVIKPLLNKNSFLIISSDLSHYYPQNMAKQIDKATLRKIKKLDAKLLKSRKYEACGKPAILTTIELAKLLEWKPKLLHYETSQAASGDQSRVVGYASIIFLN